MLGLGGAITAAWQLFPDFQSYYRSYYAASEGMAPTLEVGDRVLASMRSRVPLKRGEIVIERTNGEDYVRRVAALPGDTIAMREGIVILNSEQVAQRTIGEDNRNGSPMPGPTQRLREQFPGEASPHLIYASGHSPQDNMAELKLGNDEYFLLGDNRDNSLDSRFGSEMRRPGIVTTNRIVGRVLFRYWRKGVGLAKSKL